MYSLQLTLDLSMQRNKMIINSSLQEEVPKSVKKLRRNRLRPNSAKPGTINKWKVRLARETFNGRLESKDFHHKQTVVKNLSNTNLVTKKLTNNEHKGIIVYSSVSNVDFKTKNHIDIDYFKEYLKQSEFDIRKPSIFNW